MIETISKRSIYNKLGLGSFGILGIVGVGYALYFGNETRIFLQKSEKAEAVVSDVKIDVNEATLTFTASDGVEYEISEYLYGEPLEIGQRVEVRYDPADPAYISINTFGELWGTTLIIGGIGALFLLCGLFPLLYRLRREQQLAQLRLSGHPVTAVVTRIEHDEDGEPLTLYAEWKSPDGQVHQVESEWIWGEMSGPQVGQSLIAYVDMNNPKKALLDLSHLDTL